MRRTAVRLYISTKRDGAMLRLYISHFTFHLSPFTFFAVRLNKFPPFSQINFYISICIC